MIRARVTPHSRVVVVIVHAKHKEDRLSRWVTKLAARRQQRGLSEQNCTHGLGDDDKGYGL